MSDFVRAAVLGTAQGAGDAETGTEADAMVGKLAGLERERAFLLRAGALAVLRRAARIAPLLPSASAAAPLEERRRTSERLGLLLSALFEEGETEVLGDALARLDRAGLRLPEELLPRALSTAAPALRDLLRPVLGARGAWLAALRPEWRWAFAPSPSAAELPPDLEVRWAEGTSAERAALLGAARRLDPPLARRLVVEHFAKEKADHRLAWLALFEADLSPEDEPFLAGATGDRSAQVRVRAARLLWRLPESAVARRARDRAAGLVAFAARSSTALSKLKGLLGGGAKLAATLSLPPEAYDPAWEKDGVVETAPHGIGRRQWWLTQMIAAVAPGHWAARDAAPPAALIAAVVEHEMLGAAVLDGLTSSALSHGARDWFAPLWDAWYGLDAAPAFTEQPLRALTARLAPSEIEPRALRLLGKDAPIDLLAGVPRPWPPAVARAFLAALPTAPTDWAPLLAVAALAIPLELLPDTLPAPEPVAGAYDTPSYLRAFDRMQSTLALRRAIAKEIAP